MTRRTSDRMSRFVMFLGVGKMTGPIACMPTGWPNALKFSIAAMKASSFYIASDSAKVISSFVVPGNNIGTDFSMLFFAGSESDSECFCILPDDLRKVSSARLLAVVIKVEARTANFIVPGEKMLS